MFEILNVSVSHGDLVVTSGFGVEFYLDLRWILWAGLAVFWLRVRKEIKKSKRGF